MAKPMTMALAKAKAKAKATTKTKTENGQGQGAGLRQGQGQGLGRRVTVWASVRGLGLRWNSGSRNYQDCVLCLPLSFVLSCILQKKIVLEKCGFQKSRVRDGQS